MKYKKILVLIPSAYNIRALGDILNFVSFYKNDLNIFILAKEIKEDIIDCKDYSIVKVNTSYGRYIRTVADYIIDAGSVDNSHKKGKNQKFYSVWHGIPYKKMFFDKPKKEVLPAIRYGNAYDAMISSSPYYTNIFLKGSMFYRGEIFEVGCSRMDTFSMKNNKKDIEVLKNQFNIPLDKKVILYAPTFRKKGKVRLPFNERKFFDLFGDDYVLVTKLHYLNSLSTKDNKIIDLTYYNNIIEILLCSDILITDYSSVLFDYSIIKKPIIFFQYDKEHYFKDRGVYFNLEEYVDKESIVFSEEKLFEIISKQSYCNFNNLLSDNFYPYEDGKSTNRIVKKLDLDVSRRGTRDIIFLVNNLNEIGGIHTFIDNMAKYYKTKYNSRIFVIGIKEFSLHNSKIHLFESDYIDYALAYENEKKEVDRILKNSDGYFISMQFSAHQKFQSRLRSGNCILMFHGDSQLLIDADIFENHLDFLINKKIYNYKKLLLLSEKDSDNLKKHLPSEIALKVGYINNSIGIEYKEIDKPKTNSWAFIGRLAEQKNPLALIEIGKLIRRDNLDLKINIYGDGPLLDQITKEILDNKLGEIIILNGYENNKEKIFNENYGLIMTSKYEGYPYAILETYAYGRPVVLFDTFTAAQEMVINGETGYLVEDNNYLKIIECMYLSNAINTKKIKEKYKCNSNETIFEKWDKLFEELLEVEKINRPTKAKIEHKLKKKKNLGSRENLFTKFRKAFSNVLNKNTKNNSVKKIKKDRDEKIVRLNKITQPNSVSVIIPCYNGSKYIKKAILSIVEQKIPNYEIIVVDDGSNDLDCTRNIITKLQRENIDVILYEKEHSGLGMTRNYGIDKATKDYVYFLDADDYLPANSVSSMLLFALENDLNIVDGMTKRIYLNNNKTEIWLPSIYKKSRLFENFDNRSILYNNALSTNKLYKKSIFEEYNLKFEKGLYEDKIFTSLVYSKVPKIGVLNQVIYYWLIYGENTSISTHKDIDNFLERILAIYKSWENYPDFVKYKMFDFFLKHDLIIYIREFRLYSKIEKNTIFIESKKFVEKNKQYFYKGIIKNELSIYLFNCLIDNDFESFVKISDTISEDYYKNNIG